jgi:hypothetical protein
MYRILFFILYLFPLFVFSQVRKDDYGKSRIQNENFRWKTLSFRNFNVYYYGAHSDLAEFTGKIAEDHLFQATELLGIVPHNKLHFIVYASIPDYEQSNIGIYDPEYITSGNGSFLKSRIEVCFKGTRNEFEKDVKVSLLNTLLNTYLFGGNFKEVIQSTYFLTLPDWFVSGASHYVVEGWSEEMDNYVRNLALSGKLKNPSSFQGKEAMYIGQSIWNYFFIKYGSHEFRNLISFVKQAKSYKAAIEIYTGLSYDEFLRDWENFYNNIASDLKYDYEIPDKSHVIQCTDKIITSISSRHTGELAYSLVYKNKSEIFINRQGKCRQIRSKGKKVENRMFNEKNPLLKWTTEGKLAMIYPVRSKYYFELYDADTRKSILKRVIPELESINHFDINEKKSILILSGSTHSQCDLYSFNFQSGRLTQLTNDKFDEVSPVFISSYSKLAYISDKPVPGSPGKTDNVYISEISEPDKNELILPAGDFISNLRGTDSGFYYLSSSTGVKNIFSYSVRNRNIRQISNSILDITAFDLIDDSTAVYSLVDHNHQKICSGNVRSAEGVNKKISLRIKYLSEHKKEDMLEKPDTVRTHTKREINIYEYQFEFEKEGGESGKNFERLLYLGPRNYRNPLNIESVGSSLINDPLRGFGILLEGSVSDLLENHKIYFGAFGITDLRIKTAYLEYQFLRYRPDFRLRFERQTLDFLDKYTYNSISPAISFPFDESKKIVFSPSVTTTRYIPIGISSLTQQFPPYVSRIYAGFSESFVFDNTIQTELNVRKGFTANLNLSNYISLNTPENFGSLNLDARNFLPLIGTITLVNRFATGRFFGNSPKNFMLGGVENWFGKDLIVRNDPEDPLYINESMDKSDLFFTRFVTPVRGFGYNQQYGQKYFLINAEIRIPFAGNLYPKELSSSFFKNFQAIVFSDFGSAWTGANPFVKNNSLNKQVIKPDNSRFSATVYNYRNPFLFGYGFGFRTLVLGFFAKADLAWGTSNGNIQNRLYLSIGHDF